MSMNSDNFEFEKACSPQSLEDNTPYKSKAFAYINDINSQVYNNNGLSLVQFDLSSIYNSSQFSDAADLFLTIPIVMTAVYGSGGPAATAQVAPPAGAFSHVSLKSNFAHLIHQIEVVANGKTVQDMQPYINIYKHFKMLSQMTSADLQNSGTTLGFADVLDGSNSFTYTAGAGIAAAGNNPNSSGSYLTNNRVFDGASVAGGVQNIAGVQNINTINPALQHRVGRYIDTSASANNLFGTLISRAQLTNELRPFFEVVSNTAIWYDYAIIRVKDLCDVLAQMGLVKKLDILLRLYVNTGSVVATVGGVAGTAGGNWFTGQSNSTFTNTCPLTINFTEGALTANTTQIAAGCYIAKSPTETRFGTAIASASSGMSACRAYYSLVEIDPEKARMYLEANLNKRIVDESVVTNNYTNISSGQSFSQLIQSGIRAPLGVLVVPVIASAVTAGTGAATVQGYSAWGSAFDTFPATFAPCLSLINFQVTLGGVQQFQGTGAMNYTFENFIEQIALARDLTSGTLGLSVGLINQKWYENNKVYYCDLSRGTRADKETARNLNISFTNNSLVAIDILVFTIYNDQIVLNVSNGAVQRL
jgi:hypothetical protein